MGGKVSCPLQGDAERHKPTPGDLFAYYKTKLLLYYQGKRRKDGKGRENNHEMKLIHVQDRVFLFQLTITSSASCCNFCRYPWNFPPHTPIPKRREGRAGEHPLSDPFAIRSACIRPAPSEKHCSNPAHWEPRSQTLRLFQGHTFYCQSCGGAKPQTFSFFLSPPYKLEKKKKNPSPSSAKWIAQKSRDGGGIRTGLILNPSHSGCAAKLLQKPHPGPSRPFLTVGKIGSDLRKAQGDQNSIF